MGFYFKVRSAKTFSKATWSAHEGKDCISWDCGRYARDDVLFAVGVRGEVEQLAEEEVEKELTEVTGWLEQLARLEEKEVEEESGSSVHGSETCLREY